MWVAIQTRKGVLMTVMHFASLASYGQNKENKERIRKKEKQAQKVHEGKIFFGFFIIYVVESKHIYECRMALSTHI